MTRQLLGILFFLITFSIRANAQMERLFKPSVAISYTNFPSSKLIDSTGSFSNQTTQLAFFIPVFSHLNRTDTSAKSTYFQLMAHGNGSLSNPDLTAVLNNQNLIGATVGLTGLLMQNRKNIFSVSLAATSRNDETTISNPEIRYSGIAIYRRNVSPGFSFHLGAGYSYIIGRGVVLPAMGLSFKTGKRSRMIINFPNRISFVQRAGNKLMFTAYLKPQGGFNLISNQSKYLISTSELYLRQRESHLGISTRYRISKSFNVTADIGWAARRSISLTEGLTKNADTFYKTKIESGVYFSVGIKYIFHSVKREKKDASLDIDKEELLNDPDFYDIISE